MNVLIAGCGYVGNILAALLLQKGHTVYGLKRNVSTLPAGVNAIEGDLTDPATLTSLPKNIDHLVFLPTPASRDRAAYEDIFINGWNNIWSSLAQKPKRTILISSTAVYGQSDGGVVNEETVPVPARFNGEVLLQMEQLAASCTDQLVIARIAGIYGPGREGMIRLAESEGLEVQQSPPFYTNRVHCDDAAAALYHLLLLDEPQPLYLVSDDVSASRFSVLTWMAHSVGCPPPAALQVGEAGQGKRVDNQRLRRSGLELKFPDFRAGYSAILADRKTNEYTQ
jgi:nucleoside-diphosphate-sugar epimerase